MLGSKWHGDVSLMTNICESTLTKSSRLLILEKFKEFDLFVHFLHRSTYFPCDVYESSHTSVGWDDRALVCDSCNVFYHIACQGMGFTMYELYTKYLDRSVAWEWLKCDMPNFATTFFNTMADTSSPVGVQHTMPKTILNHPLRILIYMNCLSIENKKPNSRLLSLEP